MGHSAQNRIFNIAETPLVHDERVCALVGFCDKRRSSEFGKIQKKGHFLIDEAGSFRIIMK